MSTITKNEQSSEYYQQELAHFAYKVSHDLQTPLRSVMGFSNLVMNSAHERLTEQEKEDMEMVLSSAKHAQALVEALLQYSRLITVPFVLVKTDAEVVLLEVLQRMEENIAATNVTITHNKLPVVMADPQQLHLLLYYLLSNALMFYKEEEPLTIHITAEPYNNGDSWLFHVIDNGIGIDSKYHSVIFELFKKLHSDEKYPGLGAGLAFARRIIERHHGTIGVDSFPGEGADLWFTLPAA